MQIGILGETDWFTFKVERLGELAKPRQESERQQLLRAIGESLDYARLSIISSNAVSNAAFCHLVLSYASSYDSFQLAQARQLNFMLAFFRGKQGSYHSRTLGLTNADLSERTLRVSLAHCLPFFQRDWAIYADDSLITTLLQQVA